ncbi:S41 family peptidase [Persicitalea jodogahamensis]|uniref:Peptidase S41 n=1 Tax=Persicitalea jodogahamensis TaxID=402147 RepID=A0A8J3G842_9BACT|nr:S41 family peptidase [Persicitalea jodogahamensis]GHB55489.1 peptidase S41 [Persicitalea jodogahamensis]
MFLKIVSIVSAIVLAICFSCQTSQKLFKRKPTENNVSPQALDYFEKAFGYIRSEAYHRKEIDFDKIGVAALEKMVNAQTSADTYGAIAYVLAELKDRHSFFTPPSNTREMLAPHVSGERTMPFEASVIDREYGLIVLNSYNSPYKSETKPIADSLYRTLQYFGEKNIKGIIIDMRFMEGGTYVPFVGGLAPLLDHDLSTGHDMLFGYVYSNGRKEQIGTYKGSIFTKGGRKQAQLIQLSNWKPLPVANLPIAIIAGKYTASAGEMILIPFLSLPNVRTFGEPTYGVPTGKSNIFLADSAMISLANSATFDRNGKVYDGPIEPDVNINTFKNGSPPDSLVKVYLADSLAKAWIDKKSFQ